MQPSDVVDLLALVDDCCFNTFEVVKGCWILKFELGVAGELYK
jgi:hypothetical protein